MKTIDHIATVFPIRTEALKPPGGWNRRRSIIREFSVNTTTHGIPGIARSQNLPNRCFWTIATIIFSAIMIFLIVQSIISFFGYPTQTKVTVIVERAQVFPAFSICNFSPIRFDRFIGPFIKFTNEKNLTNTNDTSTINFLQARYIRAFFQEIINQGIPATQFFFGLETMLIYCSYNGRSCNASNFTSFLSSAHGFCYTFNAQMNSSNSSVRLLTEGGGNGKLQLRLYAHSQQYVPFVADDAGAGMIAMIHDNSELPLIEVAGVMLGPGKRHKLSFKKRTHQLLPSPYTQCTEKIPSVMQVMFDRYEGADYRYSQVICNTLCVQTYVYQNCSCIDPMQWTARSVIKPNSDEVIIAPLCSEFDPCYSVANDRIRNNETLWQQFCSHCTESCSNVDFIITTSSIAAPLGDYFIDEAKTFVKNSGVELPKNWTENWRTEIEQNYISVDIVPETTRVEIYSQTASMSSIDLLSNVGGQTGLWIGLSFLSLMEIVEMIYRLLRYHIHLIGKKYFFRPPAVNAQGTDAF